MSRVSNLEFLWRLGCRAPGYFAGSLVTAFVVSVLGLAPGKLGQWYYDAVMSPGASVRTVAPILAWLLAIPLLGAGVGYAKMACDLHLGGRLMGLLRINLFEELLNPSVDPDGLGSGYAIGMLRDDVNTVGGFFFGVISAVVLLGTSATAIVMLVQVNQRLAELVFIPLFVVILIIQASLKVLVERNAGSRKESMTLIAAVADLFAAVETIQAQGAEERVAGHFEGLNERRRSAMLRESLSRGVVAASFASVNSMGLGLILLFASRSPGLYHVTMGQLVLFSNYLGLLLGAFATVGGLLSNSSAVWVSLDRLTAWADQPKVLRGDLLAQRPIAMRGKASVWPSNTPVCEPLELLAACGLGLRYADPGGGIEGVDFELRRGTLTVVTGEAGAGKTTLLRALIGLHPRRTGTISWNGKKLDTPLLGPPFCAYAPQRPSLYSGSVRENLLLGLNRSEDEVALAIQQAQLEVDIRRLVAGIETRLGARGAGLSGGQRQRLALARALVRRCGLTVLDNPLSGLDANTARAFCETVVNDRESTYLIVSNDLDIVRAADQVLWVRGGTLAGRGTYDELALQADFTRVLNAPASTAASCPDDPPAPL